MFQPTKPVPVTEIIPFEEELMLFKRMVADPREKRFMFIRALVGRGKTCLLLLMRHHCKKQGIPWCWVDFRESSFDSPHLTLAREVCEQLAFPAPSLAQALLPLASSGTEGKATMNIDGNVTDANIINQILTNVSSADETVRRDSMKPRLRRAFAADLSTVEKTAVCFFDSFEDVSGEEESWLFQALLGPVQERKLEHMIVVTAGRRWPKINDWEWEDDAYLVNGLPPMNVDHIRLFARQVGCGEMSEQQARFCLWACRGVPTLMSTIVKNLRDMQEE
jgi:hypothetical protein